MAEILVHDLAALEATVEAAEPLLWFERLMVSIACRRRISSSGDQCAPVATVAAALPMLLPLMPRLLFPRPLPEEEAGSLAPPLRCMALPLADTAKVAVALFVVVEEEEVEVGKDVLRADGGPFDVSEVEAVDGVCAPPPPPP